MGQQRELPVLLGIDQASPLYENPDILEEARRLFHQEIVETRAKLDNALEEQQWEEARQIIYRLFESVGYCGTPHLEFRLEKTVRALQDTSSFPVALLPDLMQAMDNTSYALALRFYH